MTARDREDAYLIDAAIDIHHDDPEFGYKLSSRGTVHSRSRHWPIEGRITDRKRCR